MNRIGIWNAASRHLGRALALAAVGGANVLQAQDPQDLQIEERLARVEDENAELKRQVQALTDDVEGFLLYDVIPTIGEHGVYGLGPAASKVYQQDQGISIGGYGEGIYRNEQGGTSVFDFLRAVIYMGYRFDENWIFNSEIEFEHASTGEEGEVSVEFAYLDRLLAEEYNLRVGLLLLPVGFLNELHEPTTFLSAQRPDTERLLLPSTWRENGAGFFGDVGPFTYRLYGVNGLDATGFTDQGIRGGRQDGSQALAEDFAVVGRADWTDTPGLLAGGSIYYGDSGQDQAGLKGTTTAIYEAHVEYRANGLWTRGIIVHTEIDDVEELNAALGLTGDDSVGEELEGAYLEAGYDILHSLAPDSGHELYPFCRFEWVDTQDDVPTGFFQNPDNDFDVTTFGLHYKPIPQLAFKLDYQDYQGGGSLDRWNLAFGYAF
jgi:hypothetical protein